MRITKTSKEIADIINEVIGMDISHVDIDDDVKIDAWNDVEGNEIFFNDYIFCGDEFYHYVNQQGMTDDGLRPYFTLNGYPVADVAENNDKCFNRDGEHDDYCVYSVAGDVGEWTFDEETFNNTLEGLKIVFKVKNDQQVVIFDDEDEFVV